ncbi:hypothetical protein OAQ84_00610 [Bdellovibrionales bacterium]|nr:hypothetical protein [Bdellovibrionales bacterium]
MTQTHLALSLLVVSLATISLPTLGSQLEIDREIYFHQASDEILLGGRIHCKKASRLSCEDQESLYLTAIERLSLDGHREVAEQAITNSLKNPLRLTTLIRIHHSYRERKNSRWEAAFVSRQISVKISNKESFSKRELLSLCQWWSSSFCSTGESEKTVSLPTTQSIKDLYHESLDLSSYKNGAYSSRPRLFMFCRGLRKYPCRMVAKDRYGRPLLNKKGKIWSLPTLGHSRHQKKYNEFNGNTPSGVYLVNGVMPKANKKFVFGKFRRFIINFVPEEADEVTQKLFLPSSSHNLSWWHEAVVARDIGRGLFRIHGTGLINGNSSSPYYRFYATSGCIATRENSYDEIEYRDQRKLLDQIMLASNLDPIFENEPKLRGVLYVINIDNVRRAVTMKDLELFDIIE